jgi:NADPH:quinone reductase-like Zn-dependent oxidoreductase
VLSRGTAYEGLIDRGRLQAGETVLITAAAGGVSSAAVQIAAAVGGRVVAVASPPNHDYLLSLGASEVFDYHAAGWAQQVRAGVPGGVDLLFDGAGGPTRDQALGAVRDGGRGDFHRPARHCPSAGAGPHRRITRTVPLSCEERIPGPPNRQGNRSGLRSDNA